MAIVITMALPCAQAADGASNIKACPANDKKRDLCIVRKFKDSPEAMLIRGKLVFDHYCTLCHGETGEGNGRAAKVHNPRPANLVKSLVPEQYIEMIVRKGGKAVGRYEGMPPWEDQLTNEQIIDVRTYVLSLRGSAVP